MTGKARSSFIRICASLMFVFTISHTVSAKEEVGSKNMKRIFLNASQNKDGTTAYFARKTFKDLEYKTVNLIDFHIAQIGQETKGDDYKKVIAQLSHSNVLVIGTPVYWSDMTGYLKTFIDRLNDIVDEPLDTPKAPLHGIDVYLIVQGTSPDDAIPGITTVIKHICKRFFMNYKGIIRNEREAASVNKQLSK